MFIEQIRKYDIDLFGQSPTSGSLLGIQVLLTLGSRKYTTNVNSALLHSNLSANINMK